MALLYNCRTVSIANFIEKRESENEDAIREMSSDDNEYSCFVICDGAGGSGVFCKEWAKFLGENTPIRPDEFFLSTKHWFENVSKRFHDSIISGYDLTDLLLKKKLYRDGSNSTFCACWVDVKRKKIIYTSVGDSYFFFFEKRNASFELKKVSFVNKQDDIDANPELLNWLEIPAYEFPSGIIDVNTNCLIVMASDGLARWIILNLAMIDFKSLSDMGFNEKFLVSLNTGKYNKRKEAINLRHPFYSTSDLLDYLKDISENESLFKEEMIILHNNNEIDIDDYSLIYIDVNVSEQNSI